MILGDICTRDCSFCAVRNGDPAPPRADEPPAVAEATAKLGLSHVVITSVTRDDLPDGGAGHFAATIAAVRRRIPQVTIEVLTPDFQGDGNALDSVLIAGPDVFNHNVETVPRLYPLIRPQGDYARSLDVLTRAGKYVSETGSAMRTKSGLMVGLGETDEEVREVLSDLRETGVNIVTIGQYLAPSPQYAPIARFIHPEQYETWRGIALDMGFSAVAAGPYVRSSYHADHLLHAVGDRPLPR
jgi:lipoic acid synthetase